MASPAAMSIFWDETTVEPRVTESVTGCGMDA
jgi:hypothetical protein